MTRKEERNKASIDYADKFMAEVNKINDEQWKWAQKHPDEPTVAGCVKACWIFQRSAFLAGAEWADENPIHYDGKAYLYVLHKGVEQGKKEIIDKVKNLIKVWSYSHSTEAKYRCEAYKEMIDIIREEDKE